MKTHMKILSVFLVVTAYFTMDCSAQLFYSYTQIVAHKKTGLAYVPYFKPKVTSHISEVPAGEYNLIGQKMMTFRKNGKEKDIYTTNYFYNDSGNLVKFVRYTNEKMRSSWEYHYGDSGEIKSVDYFNKRGKRYYRIEQQFAEHGLAEYRSYKRNEKEFLRIGRSYDSLGRIVETRRYSRGKMKKRVVNTYHENGEKEKIAVFNRRGKMKYVYEFDSDPKGSEVSKGDTNSVRIEQEFLENGNRMDVYVTTMPKGDVEKRVYYYLPNDEAYKAEVFYRNSDQLNYTWCYGYDDGEKSSYEYKSFYDNGKIQRRTTEQKVNDTKGILNAEDLSKRGKTISHANIEFTFDNQHRVLSRTAYDQDNRKTSETVYSYH